MVRKRLAATRRAAARRTPAGVRGSGRGAAAGRGGGARRGAGGGCRSRRSAELSAPGDARRGRSPATRPRSRSRPAWRVPVSRRWPAWPGSRSTSTPCRRTWRSCGRPWARASRRARRQGGRLRARRCPGRAGARGRGRRRLLGGDPRRGARAARGRRHAAAPRASTRSRPRSSRTRRPRGSPQPWARARAAASGSCGPRDDLRRRSRCTWRSRPAWGAAASCPRTRPPRSGPWRRRRACGWAGVWTHLAAADDAANATGQDARFAAALGLVEAAGAGIAHGPDGVRRHLAGSGGVLRRGRGPLGCGAHGHRDLRAGPGRAGPARGDHRRRGEPATGHEPPGATGPRRGAAPGPRRQLRTDVRHDPSDPCRDPADRATRTAGAGPSPIVRRPSCAAYACRSWGASRWTRSWPT